MEPSAWLANGCVKARSWRRWDLLKTRRCDIRRHDKQRLRFSYLVARLVVEAAEPQQESSQRHALLRFRSPPPALPYAGRLHATIGGRFEIPETWLACWGHAVVFTGRSRGRRTTQRRMVHRYGRRMERRASWRLGDHFIRRLSSPHQQSAFLRSLWTSRVAWRVTPALLRKPLLCFNRSSDLSIRCRRVRVSKGEPGCSLQISTLASTMPGWRSHWSSVTDARHA